MKTESETHQKQVGAHWVRFEPPDLFIVRFVGELDADEFTEIGQTFKQATDKFYLIIFANELTGVSHAAKRVIGKIPLAAGMAMIGASRQMKFIISLLNKVYMMVNLGKDSRMTFAADEEEAAKWIASLRAESAQNRPPPA